MKYRLAILLSLVSACGRPESPLPTSYSENKALVSQAQAKQAFGIVYNLDYLPFNYLRDGCYARALYMSMELAARRIPSSAHYINGRLYPTAGVVWAYHVAPLIKVGTEEAWVLDPAFEQEPLPLSRWIRKNTPRGTYSTETKAGSAYFDPSGRTSNFNSRHMVQNFAEMPSFLSSDIASACTVMYNYIEKEGENVSIKRIELLSRTTALVSDLRALGKLDVRRWSTKVQPRCEDAIDTGLLAFY